MCTVNVTAIITEIIIGCITATLLLYEYLCMVIIHLIYN